MASPEQLIHRLSTGHPFDVMQRDNRAAQKYFVKPFKSELLDWVKGRRPETPAQAVSRAYSNNRDRQSVRAIMSKG